MGYQRGELLNFKYEYDFSVSGGAQSAIALVNKGINALEAGLVITDWYISVETTVVGASATVTMGNAGDPDGYCVDIKGSLTAGAIVNRAAVAGALTWDDTNDHPIYYKIASAADAIPTITIGTANLTAGKFQVYFKAQKP